MVKGGYMMKLESVKSLLSLPEFMSFVIYENVCHAASGHFMHCCKKNRIHLPNGPSPQCKITAPLGCTLSISLARWIFCSQLRYSPSLIQLSFGYQNFVKNHLFIW
jgi:hypothetical protein